MYTYSLTVRFYTIVCIQTYIHARCAYHVCNQPMLTSHEDAIPPCASPLDLSHTSIRSPTQPRKWSLSSTSEDKETQNHITIVIHGRASWTQPLYFPHRVSAQDCRVQGPGTTTISPTTMALMTCPSFQPWASRVSFSFRILPR